MGIVAYPCHNLSQTMLVKEHPVVFVFVDQDDSYSTHDTSNGCHQEQDILILRYILPGIILPVFIPTY